MIKWWLNDDYMMIKWWFFYRKWWSFCFQNDDSFRWIGTEASVGDAPSSAECAARVRWAYVEYLIYGLCTTCNDESLDCVVLKDDGVYISGVRSRQPMVSRIAQPALLATLSSAWLLPSTLLPGRPACCLGGPQRSRSRWTLGLGATGWLAMAAVVRVWCLIDLSLMLAALYTHADD